MAAPNDIEQWLPDACASYVFDVRGVFRRRGSHRWTVTAADESSLETLRAADGNLLRLPQEPAALANILEVSIVDFVVRAR